MSSSSYLAVSLTGFTQQPALASFSRLGDSHQAGPSQARVQSGAPVYYTPPGSSSREAATQSYRHRSFMESIGIGGPGQLAGGPSSAANRQLPALPPHYQSSAAHRHRHPQQPQPQPRHQIAEEDECPICHRELPSRNLPNFEAEREAHITICITAHSAYTGGGGSPGGGSGGAGAAGRLGTSPRRTGMFPYMATEKDCVDSAECTICLEEFEVGVRMARLECLCRFHKHCIDAWWQRHPGRCPMHQHDGLGY